MTRLYYWLCLLTFAVMTGCQSFQRTPPTPSSGLLKPFLDPLSQSEEAGTGPLMFVGSLTVLAGVIGMFLFRAFRTGALMILTGFLIALGALWLRDYAGYLLLLSCLSVIGFGVYVLTDAAFRKRLMKHAKQLRGKGDAHSAELLENEVRHDRTDSIAARGRSGSSTVDYLKPPRGHDGNAEHRGERHEPSQGRRGDAEARQDHSGGA